MISGKHNVILNQFQPKIIFVETFIVAWDHHPVSEGRKGNWRPHENYVFYGQRDAATFGDNMHIQNKGLIVFLCSLLV